MSAWKISVRLFKDYLTLYKNLFLFLNLIKNRICFDVDSLNWIHKIIILKAFIESFHNGAWPEIHWKNVSGCDYACVHKESIFCSHDWALSNGRENSGELGQWNGAKFDCLNILPDPWKRKVNKSLRSIGLDGFTLLKHMDILCR